MKHSRRYREIKEIIASKQYNLPEAIEFLRSNNQEKLKNIKASFSLHWINQKMVLKTKLTLPHTVKKERKISVINDGLPADILAKCQKNEGVKLMTAAEVKQEAENKKRSRWEFTKILAHPDSKKAIETLQKLLKELTPNKKNGSLTENILEEIEKFQQGENEIKTDKGGNIHVVIGDSNFSPEQLKENYKIIYNKIVKLHPVGWKGDFLKNITLSTAMGPGLKILK
jgi:large subunit ribosomal protein L1